MRKTLTYMGTGIAFIASFTLAAIALFMLTVIVSLLLDEAAYVADEPLAEEVEVKPDYIEAYNILDDERSVVVWSDSETNEQGKVLVIADIDPQGASFQFFGRSGDDIHENRNVMNEIADVMSEKMVVE